MTSGTERRSPFETRTKQRSSSPITSAPRLQIYEQRRLESTVVLLLGYELFCWPVVSQQGFELTQGDMA